MLPEATHINAQYTCFTGIKRFMRIRSWAHDSEGLDIIIMTSCILRAIDIDPLIHVQKESESAGSNSPHCSLHQCFTTTSPAGIQNLPLSEYLCLSHLPVLQSHSQELAVQFENRTPFAVVISVKV